ncbi:unnamed protein product [Peniophora sp. CBMAI 1063]|nr:unnamed protein product [Peniophora sp. CBMAI 1063]
MSEKIQGRPWQPHEDALLLAAIHNTQGDIDWKIIAKFVPERTNKACRKRWLHSLCPTVKKTAWTHAEDDTLLRLYEQHGPKWALIARAISGRTDDACSKRYREALDPSLKRDEWTAEEDARLIELQANMGGKWGQIGPAMGRSGLGCRNRWRLLERKRTAGSRGTGSTFGSAAGTSSITEPQAGSSAFPPLHPPVAQQVTHWGDDLLAWGAQYQTMPNSAYSYENTQTGSTSAFYATNTEQHTSSSDYNMHSLDDTFGSEDFFARLDFAQPQTTHPTSQRSSLQVQDYGQSAAFGYLSTTPIGPGPLPPDPTYTESHNQDAQSPANDAFPRRILDSQIDPALMHDFDQSPQTRPLPQYPPRVVSASQRASSPHRMPVRPTTPARPSARPSPHPEPASLVDSQSTPSALAHAQSVLFPQSPGPVASPELQQPSPLPSPPPASPAQPAQPVTDIFGDQPYPAHEHSLPPLEAPSRHTQPSIETESHGLPPSTTVSQADHDSLVPLFVQHQHQPRLATPQDSLVPASTSDPIPSEEEHSIAQDTLQKRVRKKPFLSAFLPASSDPTILAYACGVPSCWPNVNYATSSELAEHGRVIHPTLVDMLSDPELKPFRCSLAGCNKSWKSLNGLQYHLQVSRDHFRQALASASPAPCAEPQANGQVQKKGRKTHPCTFPGCTNVYKQLAGLRYHLKHGHPTHTPAQLEAVPPTLAKKIGERQARKGGAQVSMVSHGSNVVLTT